MAQLLVVDDDLGTRETFGSILGLAGFEVTTAATGRGRLDCSQNEIVRRRAGRSATARHDGHRHMLQRLRQEGATIPFVVMTAFGTVSSAVEAMKLGASNASANRVAGLTYAPMVTRAPARRHCRSCGRS